MRITGLTDREREKDIIEIAGPTPKIDALRSEIEKAIIDHSDYLSGCEQAYDYWHAEWEGQTPDGLKHAALGQPAPFPWEGGSDTRVRMGEKFVRQHVTVSKAAITQARVQATAIQPALHGREAAQGTQLLKWTIGSHMLDQQQREMPLMLAWRWGYGAAITEIAWEQEERIDEVDISLPIIDQYMGAAGAPDPQGGRMLVLMQALHDPAQEELFVGLIRRMSDMVTMREARLIVDDLRTIGTSKIPVRYTYKSQPRRTALRIGVDVLFPGGTSDLQKARFVARRELVTRGDLLGRIRTDDYDPAFVEEMLQHRGASGNTIALGRALAERNFFGTGRLEGVPGYDSGFSQLYELFHMTYRTVDRGTPCIYRTVFNPVAVGRDRENPLYATHGRFTYPHGLYPYVVHRAEINDGPILSSRGVPEIAATWEGEVKIQRDGRTDMTALELGPPIIVARSRSKTLDGYPLPRGMLTVDKVTDYAFMPTPPLGNRSIEIEATVIMTAAEFFGLFDAPGQKAPMDPDWKNLRRQEVASDVLGEEIRVMDQIFQLLQGFMSDSEVQAVIGPHSVPFPLNMREIAAKHTISATFDARMLDADWGKEKMALVGTAVQIGGQSGRINESALPEVLLNIADPSLADLLLLPAEDSAEKERTAAKQAVVAAFSGVLLDPPQRANHKLRLQTIMENSFQSPNPEMPKRLSANPDTVEILKKLIEFHQNQDQQQTENPEIGRTLATAPFQPRMALPTSTGADAS